MGQSLFLNKVSGLSNFISELAIKLVPLLILDHIVSTKAFSWENYLHFFKAVNFDIVKIFAIINIFIQ